MIKVFMIGPGRKTKGGITAVIKSYVNHNYWDDYDIIWIETHRDSSYIIKLWQFILGFTKFLTNLSSVSIIHIHLSEPTSALRKLPFFVIGRLLAYKIIIHFHSYDSKTTIKGKYQTLYRYLFQNADKLIVLSPYWEEEVISAFEDCRIEVLYNPCVIKTDDSKYSKEKSILFAGTLTERKGYHVLLRGFSIICNKHKDWKLIFAGNGEIERAKELAKELGIDKKVEFKGWVSGKEKEILFYKSSIFCLPSFAEGFPMAILDAYSYQLPVISTKCGGIDKTLTDFENILFCEMGNPLSLSEKIDKMIDDRNLRENLSIRGRLFAEQNFELKIIIKKLKRIYKQLIP